MSALLDMLLTDPNLCPQFRRQFSDTPHAREVIAADLLERAKAKAEPRRFDEDDRMTWFDQFNEEAK